MNLKVTNRNILGRKVGFYRKQGNIPAVIYGRHISSPINIFVQKNEFIRIYREAGKSTVINLTGDQEHLVLIQDIQVDFVRDNLQHIDLLAVNANEQVEADVKVVLAGESPLEKLGNGQVQLVKDYITVSALPQDLPHDISVDISTISSLDDGIFVRDIVMGNKVSIVDDMDAPVVVAVGSTNDDDVTQETIAVE